MRVGALILGILGGLFGIGGAVLAILAGGVGAAFGAEEAETVVGLGLAALALSIVGIIGSALALAKPRAAAALMLVTGIGGFIAISFAFVIGGTLLIAGSVLAFFGRTKKVRSPAVE